MKKLIALIIALCLLLSLGLSVCAADGEAELAAKKAAFPRPIKRRGHFARRQHRFWP